MAEREGFEPSCGFPQTDFECVRPFGRKRKIPENKRSSKTLENLEKRGLPTSFVLYALQGKGIRAVTEFAQITGKWREIGEKWREMREFWRELFN